LEPKILTVPAFTAVGLKYRGKNENNDIPKWWDDKFIPRVHEIKHKAAIAYGIMGNYDPATGEFDYLAAYGVDKVEDIPPGMERLDIPEGKYAAFPTTLPTLPQTIHMINSEWLPNSGYERDMRWEFELYPEDFRGGDSELFFYVPIK
jgi:AraC family transcriptional regulator